jgi:hypothetical protein
LRVDDKNKDLWSNPGVCIYKTPRKRKSGRRRRFFRQPIEAFKRLDAITVCACSVALLPQLLWASDATLDFRRERPTHPKGY